MTSLSVQSAPFLEHCQMDEERLISYAETITIVGVSKAEIARRIKDKKFPEPVQDGPYQNSRRFFVLSEIRDYVKRKIETRRQSP